MLDLADRGAVAAGPSAAWSLDDRAFADPDDPVHVYVPRSVALRPQPDCILHRVPVPLADVMRTDLGAATRPVRTAVDLARGVGTGHLPAGRRLALVERVLRTSGVTAAEVRAAADAMTGLHGMPRARRLLRWARTGSTR
jgi:hypothetical protein